MPEDRLRLLLLDDNPGFIESETGMPSFAAASGIAGRALFERNFDLSWMYNLSQAKAFAARTRIAMIDDPTQLLGAFRYPNLLLFDYSMDQADNTARALRSLGSMPAYETTLDPLAGDWGSQVDILGFDDAGFAAEIAWHPTPGEDQHGGCLAGVDISSLLDHYAFIGVPQTRHYNLKTTAALEWHLSCHLGSLFERKSSALANWFAFFDKALLPLRTKLLIGTRRGSLIPRITDLLEMEGEDDIDRLADRAVTFSSALGTEALRIEGLFLDIFYRWDSLTDSPVRQPDADILNAVSGWTSDLLDAAAGPARQTDVRAGLSTAARFIAANADTHHYRRRGLSRELGEASPCDIDLAVDNNRKLIEALGVAPRAVKQALHAGCAAKLELSDSAAIAWGTLGSIEKEAPSPLAARFAAIALMVWGEMAWQGSVLGDLDQWMIDVEDLLESRSAVSTAMIDRFENLSGLYVPDGTLARLAAGPNFKGRTSEVLRAVGREVAIFANIQEYLDMDAPRTCGTHKALADTDEPRRRASQEVEAKHNFLRYLFAPAPRKLLMWQEADTDIDRPLARLGVPDGTLKFSIRAVLEGKDAADGGLRPGEHRLVRLFAREFGFAERYWAAWMRGSMS